MSVLCAGGRAEASLNGGKSNTRCYGPVLLQHPGDTSSVSPVWKVDSSHHSTRFRGAGVRRGQQALDIVDIQL